MNSLIVGDKRFLVLSGTYFSVESHNSRVYAVNRYPCAIEIYGHSGDTWWGLRRIHTPFNREDIINLWVNDKNIYASSWDNDAIFVFNHDGTILGQHGVRGSGEAGKLDHPLLCHGDDDGDVFIADWGNLRLQVLHGDGHFSVVNIPIMWWPDSAVYTPGRLFVFELDPTSDRGCITVYLPDPIKILANVEQGMNEFE